MSIEMKEPSTLLNSDDNSDITEKKATLLTDESFNKLRSAQRLIQDITEYSPSLRLLINTVINDESIEYATNQLIQKIQRIETIEASL